MSRIFTRQKHAYSDSEWHWRSVCVLRKLIKLEQSGLKFDYIEFPDWGGLGFAATQEKLFADAFAETLLAVRLHCTEGVLHTVEARLFNQNALSLYDIERKALRDCDRVVAQLLPVGEYNRDIYGFDEAEWQTRLCLHPPPVLIDRSCSTKSLEVGRDTPIIFTSKFQQVKAPEVFVRACVGFMRLCPDYLGEVRFLAHNTDPESVAHVKTLIPEDLQHRFRFYESIVPHALREQLISEGVAVFPSRFESFCLAAYEASLLGSIVVLNGVNPAFGDDTPWVDGNNCIKFGGTVESLVAALQRLFLERPNEMTPVRLPSGSEPWHAVGCQSEVTTVENDDPELPLVSVIIPNFNLGDFLPQTIRSVIESSYPNIEIIICDDASTGSHTIDILGRLNEAVARDALKIVYARYSRGLAGARNLAIKEAQGKYILTLDAGALISPDFMMKSVGALERNIDYSIVVPQSAYFSSERTGIPRLQSEYIGFAIFHGEAFASGFSENRFSSATMLARRALFDEIQYREELHAFEDWDFYLRSLIAGKRFIVTNELHFFSRRLAGSMNNTMADPVRLALFRDDLRRIHRFQIGAFRVPASACYPWQPLSYEKAEWSDQAILVENQWLLAEVEQYRNSEAVRVALHLSHFFNARMPWILKPLKVAGGRVWRVYNRLRRRPG